MRVQLTAKSAYVLLIRRLFWMHQIVKLSLASAALYFSYLLLRTVI